MAERTTITVELDGGVMPVKAHEGDSGYDLCSNEDVAILPLSWKVVHTGVRLKMPIGYEAQVRSRSGNAAKLGLFVMNSPGTVDSGYRGEVCAILFNASKSVQLVKKYDRVAQLVFCKLPDVELNEGIVDIGTERGEGGFGSTGTIGGSDGR